MAQTRSSVDARSRAHGPPVVPGPEQLPTVERLLRRMQDGDRDAVGAFITQYGARIRRRIRGKLGPAMRRIFDSQEILSTVGRRLDLYIRSGRLDATTEQQLWALVFRMANNAVIDKSRVFRRLQRVESEDGPLAQSLLAHLRRAERRGPTEPEIEIEKVLDLVPDPTDRQILCLWLAGTRLNVIAICVDLAPTAVRKRWQGIRQRLHKRLSGEGYR